MSELEQRVARVAWPYWRTEGNAGALPHDLPWNDGSDISATAKERAEVLAIVQATLNAHVEYLEEQGIDIAAQLADIVGDQTNDR